MRGQSQVGAACAFTLIGCGGSTARDATYVAVQDNVEYRVTVRADRRVGELRLRSLRNDPLVIDTAKPHYTLRAHMPDGSLVSPPPWFDTAEPKAAPRRILRPGEAVAWEVAFAPTKLVGVVAPNEVRLTYPVPTTSKDGRAFTMSTLRLTPP